MPIESFVCDVTNGCFRVSEATRNCENVWIPIPYILKSRFDRFRFAEYIFIQLKRSSSSSAVRSLPSLNSEELRTLEVRASASASRVAQFLASSVLRLFFQAFRFSIWSGVNRNLATARHETTQLYRTNQAAVPTSWPRAFYVSRTCNILFNHRPVHLAVRGS